MDHKLGYNKNKPTRYRLNLKSILFIPYRRKINIDPTQLTITNLPIIKQKLFIYNKLFFKLYMNFSRLQIVDINTSVFDDEINDADNVYDNEELVEDSCDIESISKPLINLEPTQCTYIIYSSVLINSSKNIHITKENFYLTTMQPQIDKNKLENIKKKLKKKKKLYKLTKFTKLYLYLITIWDMFYENIFL
jgi:hypothetical protein